MKKPPPLPRICIAATGETSQALLDCAQRALEHGRFVELRLDLLAHPEEGLDVIPRLLKFRRPRAKKKAIFLQATCRREESGGKFRGPVDEQLKILRQAISLGCRVVDLEIESAEEAGAEAVESLRQQAALILSWHDFHSTPSPEFIARRLRRIPADYYKLVPTATRQSDNCTVLDFLRSAASRPDERWIAFCMEQSGIPSRVLALSRGSALVYASLPPQREPAVERVAQSSAFSNSAAVAGRRTEKPQSLKNANSALPVPLAAPGQVDAETLRVLYRAEKLTAETGLYGLLGYPIGHSVGAAIHNAAFRAMRFNGVYLPLLASDLKEFGRAAERYPLAGFSVTIPHKQGIFRMLDRVDTVARMAGAANTVRVRGDRWEGINSDVEGVADPLRKAFGLSEREYLEKNFRAVIVGAGGAARAALAALRQLRCRNIFVAARSLSKASNLARYLGGRPLPFEKLETEKFDLLIHATPVGMWPRNGECLLTPQQIHADTVFDLVYNPIETQLLEIARECGSRTIPGLEMFLAQAVRQFEYWTETEAPRALMRRVAKRELERFPKTAQP